MIDMVAARFVTLTFSVAVLFTCLLGQPIAHHQLTREVPPYRVAVIGDSYTAGTEEGGLGANGWTAVAWQTLARQGFPVLANVAAEGRAGYGAVGNRGSVFLDLTGRAVRPGVQLVVFYGSRNDQDVRTDQLTAQVADALRLAKRTAPTARLLVIGPPWPTAEIPAAVLSIRDVLRAQAGAVGARFVDPIAARWFVDQPELIGPDGVHPTDAGHAYMADKIAPLIASELPRSV